MTPLVLRLPWPPPELSPNARVHWAEKQRATRDYRFECFASAANHRISETFARRPVRRRTPLSTPVTARVVFVVPDRRRRDLDNALASMKAAWDGLVDQGLLVDDDSKHLKLAAPEMRYEKGSRYVEVTLT